MTVSTENAPSLKFAPSANSDFSVQIQIEPNLPFEFVQRDTR